MYGLYEDCVSFMLYVGGFVVSNGVFMDLTCLDCMEELHLVIIAHRICERVIIRLYFLNKHYLVGACMASHIDHLVDSSYMLYNTWHLLH